MTTRQEQHWLRTYAAESYTGSGAIVDLGCFLGATTISLAEGLALNRKTKRKQIHAYDRFNWGEAYETWAKGREVEGLFAIGSSFLPEFLRRTREWRDYIVVHEGDLSRARWEGEPIEFLFIDAMKTRETASTITRTFFPHLIPATGYVAQQDFAHAYTPWIHVINYRLRDYFSLSADVPSSGTTVFRCEKQISASEANMDVSFARCTIGEIEAVFDYSISLVSEDKKANAIAAKAMAYVHRSEFARAHEVIMQSRYGPASLADQFNTVKSLTERNLAASELSSGRR
jgi:hypothetical protein